MPNITKHDAEEKRESDGGENAGVHLLVPRDSISISDLLRNYCIRVCGKGCGRVS